MSELSNIRQSGDTQLAAEVALAAKFWSDRHVSCPTIHPMIAEFPLGMAVAAAGSNGYLFFDGRYIGANRYLERHSRYRGLISRRRIVEEATVVIHEVGHACGLGHTATGVMAPTVIDYPWTARVFARQAALAMAASEG